MIIQELGLIGEVTLVRFVNDTMWVTFRDGQSALIASRKNAIRIRGLDFLINLKTEDWVAHVEREIALCSSNTVQLCTTPGNYLFFFVYFRLILCCGIELGVFFHFCELILSAESSCKHKFLIISLLFHSWRL